MRTRQSPYLSTFRLTAAAAAFPSSAALTLQRKRSAIIGLACAFLAVCLAGFAAHSAPLPLFDGKTFDGWEGETNQVWRIQDGTVKGGSLQGNPRNEFLATTRGYTNFHLTFEYRLVGTEGFVNGGVQFRSRRIPNPPNEMSGYQADIGAGFSGCLYDESRRNRMLVAADSNLVQRIEKPGDWNRYEVRAVGVEVQLFLNGQRTVAWVEETANIERSGVIALQIHGNCKAEISFRNITIEELPVPAVPTQAEVLNRFGSGQPAEAFAPFANGQFTLNENEVIVFVGQENLVREQKIGAIEAVLAVGFAAKQPRFRSMAWEADTVYEQWRDLNFGPWAAQLERAGATAVLVQLGQMETLDGVGRLPEFMAAYHRLLDQFAARTRRVILLSPMPFETPLAPQAPDLAKRNAEVLAYVGAIRAIAAARQAVFADIYTPLSKRPAGAPRLTEDGIHLTDAGLREVARVVGNQLGAQDSTERLIEALRPAISEKNQLWFDCWRPANWSFVYGDRVAQRFAKGEGEDPSLKEAFERHRPLIAASDERIHALARGGIVPVRGAAPSPTLKSTQTSPVAAAAQAKPLSPEDELAALTPAEGYQVNLFASEREDVVKPTQFSWDEQGRLYVACSPTYPHTQASAPPADYILVLHDTDGDGRADRSWRFADKLTMVQGVQPGAGGVYVCDFDQLLHFRDTDGDGKADSRRIVFSGFGIGDTHQLVNSITYGPDGSLWFTQGLHAFSRVETPWGIARLDRAAVWRMRPQALRLDGFFGGGMAGANCWGVAFDDFGQVFHKSGDRPHGYWTVPGLVRGASPIGSGSASSADTSYANSPEQYHSVGPLFDTSPKTTALDIIGTRALPDDVQGGALIGGYFGGVIEVHKFEDAGSGFKTTQLPRLLRSSTSSFRPVDVGVGPDGAIYLADWFNPVIGHYQASYADPQRDKAHGRIWRLSAKERKPIRQPNLAAMQAGELLEQLRSAERWTRQQAKRLLFDQPPAGVLKAADEWVERLNTADPDCEKLLLEVAGVFEAHDAVRPVLLDRLLSAKDPRVRAYATRMIGAWSHRLPDALAKLQARVRDENPRVRLEAVVASSYLSDARAVEVVTQALESPRDAFLDYAMRQSARALQPLWGPVLARGESTLGTSAQQTQYLRQLLGTPPPRPTPGQTLYEMACLPCHQPEGKGLAGIYPPLAGSEWVQNDANKLIRILLHGLSGPIQVAGADYGGPNAVPMPSMAGLEDEQIAQVLSYIRSAFGNKAAGVAVSTVRDLRAANASRDKPWTVEELQSK